MSKKKHQTKIAQPEISIKTKTNPFLKKSVFFAALFYFVILIITFASVLFKPLNSPDSISQAYPIYSFIKSFFGKHFSLPFWFPYMSGGTPFLEGLHFNWLFDWPVYLFSIPLGIGYRAFIFVFLTGLLSFLFFKKSLKLSTGIAFLGGLVYMLSADSITYTASVGHYGKVVNMAFLPLALLFIDSAFQKKNYAYFFFLGLPLSYMYHGHPQVFFYNIIIISVYVLFKLFTDAKEDKSKIWFGISGYALAGVVAILLSFDNLYQQLAFVKMTSRGAVGDPAQAWAFATSWSEHPLELLTYFMPSLWGLKDATYLGWKPFVSTSDYVGLIVIFIALYGIIANWKNKTVRFFSIATLLAILFGFGKHFAPYYKLFYNKVPMIKKFRVPSTIYIIVAFFFVYFFVLGLKSLITHKNKKHLMVLLSLIVVIGLFFTVFIGSAGYKNILKENISHKINIQALSKQYSAYQIDAYLNKTIQSTVETAHKDIPRYWIFSLLFILILWMFQNNKLKQNTFLILLGILIFIDLYSVDKKFIRPIDNYNMISRQTDAVRFLKQDKTKFRILPFPPGINNESNKWSFFDLESAGGYNAISLKVYDDVQKAGLLYNLKFLGLFNVKYLLSRNQYNDTNIKLVFKGSKAIYSNKEFLPRYFFINNYKVITNDKILLTYMKSTSFEPTKELLLKESPNMSKNSVAGTNSIQVVKYGLDKIVFKANIQFPTFLFLSEIYYPKWECFINGEKTKIYQADHLFRAVALKQGEQEIVFKYRNKGTYLILTLSTLILNILMLLLLFGFFRKKDNAEEN